MRNLVAVTKELFNARIIKATSIYLGETESSVYKALSAAIPIGYTQLLYVSSVTKDRAVFNSLLATGTALKPDPVALLIGSAGAAGIKFTQEVSVLFFKEKIADVAEDIADHARIKIYAAHKIVTTVTAILLSVTAKEMSAASPPYRDLHDVLIRQQNNIVVAIPHDISMEGILGIDPDVIFRQDIPLRRTKPFAFSTYTYLTLVILAMLIMGIAYYYFYTLPKS